MEKNFINYIENGIKHRQLLLQDLVLQAKISELIELIIKCIEDGNKVMFAGNGGSAADSQHLSAELVSRFKFDRPGLASVALTTDTSALTAIGNDYGFEFLFIRQLQAIGRPGDIFIGLSTSGKSKNILNALEYSAVSNIKGVIFTGDDTKNFNENVLVVNTPSNETCFIQEIHITIGHYICEQVERRLFS